MWKGENLSQSNFNSSFFFEKDKSAINQIFIKFLIDLFVHYFFWILLFYSIIFRNVNITRQSFCKIAIR